MQKSSAQDKIVAAIMAARQKMEPVLKAKTAHVESNRGASYEYKYAGAAEYVNIAQAALLDQDLMLTFDPTVTPGETKVVKEQTATDGRVEYEEIGRKLNLVATIEQPSSGQWRSTNLEIGIARSAPGMNLYQALGAAITYMSGILTRCLMGMAAEDDDALEGGKNDPDPEMGRQPAPEKGRGAQPVKEPQAAKQAQQPPASRPAPQGEIRVDPKNLDSYEAATQMLVESTMTPGGSTVPLFTDTERAKLTADLNAAARDVGKMVMVYATILNASNANRERIEGRKQP